MPRRVIGGDGGLLPSLLTANSEKVNVRPAGMPPMVMSRAPGSSIAREFSPPIAGVTVTTYEFTGLVPEAAGGDQRMRIW